jgi:hypothetical protein
MKIPEVDRCLLAVVSALVLSLSLFAPLQIFLNNTIESSQGFPLLFLIFLLISFVLIAVLYGIGRTVLRSMVLAMATFLSVVAFLESRIFFVLAEHLPFAGESIDWAKFAGLSRLELIAIAGVAILIRWVRRRQDAMYSIALFILLFHTAGFLYACGLQFDGIQRSAQNLPQTSSYFKDFYRLSRQRNVLHIVLDHAQGALFYEILLANWDRYSPVLEGFTVFPQAAGRYPGTYPSVSFYMTGRGPEPETDMVTALPFSHDHVRHALREHSIVNTLAGYGFQTFGFQAAVLYCEGAYTGCTARDLRAARPVKGMAAETAYTMATLLDVALFQSTPIVIRRLVYNHERWFLRQVLETKPSHSGILDLFLEKLVVDKRSGSYNYFHLAGGHPPIQFDENCQYVGIKEWNRENTRAQLSCDLLQLTRLAQKLQQLGIYDQTMIIVHGDHGSQWRTSLMNSLTGSIVSPEVIGSANPVLLVKPPRALGPLQFSAAPVSLGDLPATINDALVLGGDFPGVPMFRLEETAERERDYIWFEPTPEVFQEQALTMVKRFRIRGDLFNQYNWIPPDLSAWIEPPSTLSMDQENFSAFAQGFSTLEHHSRPVRWVDGKLARVYLSFPTDGPAQLAFECYVPPSIRSQSVRVAVNGSFVAMLEGRDLTASLRHVFPLPDDVPRRKVNVVEFTMAKAVRFETDVRHLSVLFASVGLEPQDPSSSGRFSRAGPAQ